MKREAKLLLQKATDSLLLGIEQFNKPFDTGRVEAVLILLDHSLEMQLKAAIVERGGRIKEKGEPQTIGFDNHTAAKHDAISIDALIVGDIASQFKVEPRKRPTDIWALQWPRIV